MITDSTHTSGAARGRQARRLALVLFAVLMSVVGGLPVTANETPPPAEPATSPTPAGPPDDLQRGVPRTAMLGYLNACREGDYQRAAEYLDLRRLNAKERATKGPVLARYLKVVIDHAMLFDPDTLSDEPDGDAGDGLPPRRDRLGTIHTAKGPVDVLLDRVARDDGVFIWKISAVTVAKIPTLNQEFGYGPLGDLLPTPLVEISFLGIELWQWLGLAVLILVSLVVASLVSRLVTRLLGPLVARLRNRGETTLDPLVVGPMRLAIAITIFYAGSYLLALSLSVRAFLNGVAETLVIGALVWFGARLIDVVAARIAERLVMRGQARAMSVLPLGRRIAKAFLVAVATLALFENLGFNVNGVLAGLGIGGLAVALAAQETIKNVFGGVALITDQPVRVGDFCRFGNTTGIVEDISIWSTRIRTLDRTVVSIPNGQFASMQLENFSRRDRMWLHATLGLHLETTPEQLRQVLEQIRKMLTTHPKVQHDNARALFAGFSGPSFQVEISAYLLTSRVSEFMTLREAIFLQILDIVGQSGTKLAPA